MTTGFARALRQYIPVRAKPNVPEPDNLVGLPDNFIGRVWGTTSNFEFSAEWHEPDPAESMRFIAGGEHEPIKKQEITHIQFNADYEERHEHVDGEVVTDVWATTPRKMSFSVTIDLPRTSLAQASVPKRHYRYDLQNIHYQGINEV